MGTLLKQIRPVCRIPRSTKEWFLFPESAGAQGLFAENGIYHAGMSEIRAGYRIIQTLPDLHCIVFTHGGHGYVRTDDGRLALTPNTLLIMPARHRCDFGPVRNAWNICWYYLRESKRWACVDGSAVTVRHCHITPLLRKIMETYVFDLYNHIALDRNQEMYGQIVLNLLDRALGHDGSGTMDGSLSLINHLRARIKGDIARRWDLNEMAREVFLSPSTLQRRMRRNVNQTPHQMVRSIKMEQAQILLRHTDYPIRMIADRLGYPDPFVFSASFKKVMGVSPRRYRLAGRRTE